MNQKLSDWTNVAQILSSLGVIVTLAYIAVQTHQNSASIEANSRQVSINSDLEILAAAFSSDTNINLLKFKNHPTDEEASKLETWLIMLVRSREQQWFQYRDGLLDRKTWDSYLTGLRANLSTPTTRRWWNARSNLFDPGFAAVVDKYLSTVPIAKAYTNDFVEPGDDVR
jgi:hypothetical protein